MGAGRGLVSGFRGAVVKIHDQPNSDHSARRKSYRLRRAEAAAGVCNMDLIAGPSIFCNVSGFALAVSLMLLDLEEKQCLRI